ncbi:rab11 family-interacting protein 1-like isoform X2 [Narcine bancroftii]|uniref:rab11 family-interacting protein 1-like isoform X2 n=1 Tax=Narcine bancroftii TaxID=1343680 RepID=UPI003831F83A
MVTEEGGSGINIAKREGFGARGAGMSLLQQQQSLHWSPTHVKVVVVRARGLRAKGKDGTNDAYAIMQLGKEKYSSSVAEKSSEPLWREEAEFELPVLQQGGADKSSTLYLIVMHRALVGLDKFLGQAVINLSELYHHKTRNKVGWHKLHSKPGKKEKERGDIEVDIRFVRNNMTASMFDLSMKDKSRSTFGKLKDKIKGKKKGGFSDSASAVVPSISAPLDSDDEGAVTEKKKKLKLKMLFPKSNLQRTSLSQSMSVIPTGPSSPADIAKKTSTLGDEDFTEVRLHNSPEEDISSKTLFVPKIMSHKRSSSADTKQLNLAPTVGGKKETLLFGGVRPKNDPVSQSSLCINGSHVYTEEPNPIPNVKPKSDPKLLSNSQFYVFSEDLAPKLPTASTETSSTLSSKFQTQTASHDQALKSPKVPASQSLGSTGDLPVSRGLERPKEKAPASSWNTEQEELGKNAESSKALTGATKSLNPFEDGQSEEEQSARSMPKGEAATKKEEPKRGGIMALFPRKTEAVKAPETKDPQNPFDAVEMKKPPSSSVWSNRTAAVKPKLDVSPEANSLLPPSLSEPHSPPALSDPFSSAPAISMKASDFSSLHLTYSPPASVLPAQPFPSSLNAKLDSLESRLDELCPSTLFLSPSACSSSSSRSSNAPTSQLLTAEHVEGMVRQVDVPLRQGSKMSSQLLFQELTGRKQTPSSGQPSCNGVGVYPSTIEQDEELTRDAALETNPEGKFENTEESEKANDKQQRPLQLPGSNASQGKESTDPSVSIVLSPVPTSETNLPTQPPKVFPRSILSSSVASQSPKPLLIQKQKILPTPKPRNLTKTSGAISSDASLQSAETQPSENLISLQWNAECSAELVKGSAVVQGAGTVPSENIDADQQRDDYRGTLVAALDPVPSSTTISKEIPDISVAKEMDVIEECPSGLWPSRQLVLPGKVENSAGDTFATEQAVEMGSPLPSREPGTPSWEGDARTLFDLDPDPTQIIAADSDHPCRGQLMKIEPGHQESTQGEINVDDVTVTQREGEPYGQSPADDGESAEISKKTNFGDPEPIMKVLEQELAHGTSDLSAEPFSEREQQTSESSGVNASTSNQLPESGGQAVILPTPDSLGFSTPSRSLSALTQSAFPIPDVPPLTKPPARSCHGTEQSGQKKPLQARVLPTETQPIHSRDNASGRRPHPVKPLSATETRFKEMSSEENLKSKMKNINVLVTKSSAGNSLATNKSQIHKAYDPSDPAAAYAQLTHDELVQLILKQKETIAKKEGHTRELENYIDNLLVRVMEETPNILRVAYQPNRRAERV